MGRIFETRKHKMFKRYAKMAKTFTKIGKDIAIAVKQGGPNPESNSKLRAVLQNAKAANMPKENVERAIKKATSKEQEDYKELVYEGYAPHGVAMMVETATDNPNRTVANLRSYFSKLGGSLGNSGSVEFLFEHKCVFKIAKNNINLEELEFELIDYGAEEVFEDEDQIMIYGAFAEFGKIQKFLEEKGFELLGAEFERVPLDTKELSEEQANDVFKLIDRLEEDDDVQSVHHNMR
ncbi:MAG: YebC/PmpR family DNA-binding transcriptional regulator [Cytophagales bacterium]